MLHKEYQLLTKDNIQLYLQSWQPEYDCKAVVNLVHGMGEHSTRYDHWAERFVNQGIAVIAFDLRGHGKTGGKRGDSPNYEAILDDISVFLEFSQKQFPQIPQILYGHSLGGNLVINYALRRKPKISVLIATSPWLRLGFDPPKIKMLLAKVMQQILPSLAQPSGLITKHISHDPAEVQKYEKDTMVHDKISVRMFLGVYQAGIWAVNHAQELNIPTLLTHGSGDKITSHKASIEFARNTSHNVTIKVWDDLYHEMHHEFERGKVFEFILGWIESNLSSKAK